MERQTADCQIGEAGGWTNKVKRVKKYKVPIIKVVMGM